MCVFVCVVQVLTLFGGVVESIGRLSVSHPSATRHVEMIKRVKRQLHNILRHAWQVRAEP